MIDLTQFLSIGGLGALLMIIVQAFKPQIPDKYLGYIPYVVAVTGVLSSLLFAWATNNLISNEAIVSYSLTGLLAGLASVGLYQNTLDKLRQSTPTK